MPDGSNLIIGQNNTGDATTKLTRTGAVANDAFMVENQNGLGIVGVGSGASGGVTGQSPAGTGVIGTSTSGIGVRAVSTANIGLEAVSTSGIGAQGNSTSSAGVEGRSSSGVGVRGKSASGPGVFGDSTNDAGVQGVSPTVVGVQGNVPGGVTIAGASGSNVGVQGNAPTGIGVEGNSTSGRGVRGKSTSGEGVTGTSTSDAGVAGTSYTGAGVSGSSRYAPGVSGASTYDSGVFGDASSMGVRGRSARIGVKGEGGIGVHGQSGFIGVYGDAPDRTGVWGRGRVGVVGTSSAAEGVYGNSSTGTGVKGESNLVGVAGIAFGTNTSAVGVLGVSRENRFGVRGRSTKAAVFRVGGSFGIVGAGVLAESPTGTGILARTGAPGVGLSGAFVGDVAIGGDTFIFGSLIVTGAKAAAVRHPDGSHRLTYALESPESFFEDFGHARVVRGRARVRLDRDFAALVDQKDYHMFLTPEGDSRGLYVSRKGRDFFEVREQQGGTSTLGFSYRVVARRKDLPHRRLARMSGLGGLRVEEVPPPEKILDIPPGRKAPTLPDPLKTLERLAPARARRVTRRGKGRKGAKRARRR